MLDRSFHIITFGSSLQQYLPLTFLSWARLSIIPKLPCISKEISLISSHLGISIWLGYIGHLNRSFIDGLQDNFTGSFSLVMSSDTGIFLLYSLDLESWTYLLSLVSIHHFFHLDLDRAQGSYLWSCLASYKKSLSCWLLQLSLFLSLDAMECQFCPFMTMATQEIRSRDRIHPSYLEIFCLHFLWAVQQ